MKLLNEITYVNGKYKIRDSLDECFSFEEADYKEIRRQCGKIIADEIERFFADLSNRSKKYCLGLITDEELAKLNGLEKEVKR